MVVAGRRQIRLPGIGGRHQPSQPLFRETKEERMLPDGRDQPHALTAAKRHTCRHSSTDVQFVKSDLRAA